MPCKSTLLARRAHWIKLGVFEDLMRMLMVDPDEVSFVDCTFIECKQPHDDRGWTKIGNGLKIMVICRDDGKIVAINVACASKAEYKLLQELLAENPGLIIQWLIGDSAYDVAENRERCEARGAHIIITTNNWPTRKQSLDDPEERAAAKRERNIIERVNAWLKNWRGVATCYCRSAATYVATLVFAVAAVNGRT
jgi:transposase